MIDAASTRVRFAPSPTGYLHIGGLRTALYNFLFARHCHGTFVLRIEDTDRNRYVEGATDNLIETLRWAGLDFDEGPGIDGGFGPYIQSRRLAIYNRHAEGLLDSGQAYPCFCTPGEVESGRRETGMYNKKCRTVDPAEARERILAGEQHTMRLKVPADEQILFTDIIHGQISIRHQLIDDQVLVKSDGYPTYHLANVVDDHLMNITHVIRGEEWLPSTPKHVLLYEAFGWQQPVFAHLPLLLNPDRSKLSKRQGDVSVEEYRSKGFLATALLNFVALLGWNTSDDQELYSIEELIRHFSLDRVGKSGAVMDIEKLKWYNSQYLQKLSDEELTALCLPHLASQDWKTDSEAASVSLVAALRKYLKVPSDIVDHAQIFFEPAVVYESEEARNILRTEEARTLMARVADAMDAVEPWERNAIKEGFSALQKDSGLKGKEFFQPVRVALTGRLHGPDLPIVSEVFGKDKCVRRFRDHLPQASLIA